jgi:putative peptidoglycan lipid II flippase
LPAGSLAIYNFANNLNSFPVGLVGISFAVAAFPALAGLFAKKQLADFNKTFQKTVSLIIFAILPLAVLFFTLRVEIVRVVLGAGVFDWSATHDTAEVLGIFVLSLIPQALVPFLSRAFYARQNTWAPLGASVAAMILNVILCALLAVRFGVVGLAASFTLCSFVNCLILIFILRRQIGAFGGREILSSFAKVASSSLVMGAVVYFLLPILEKVFDLQRFWGVFLQAFIAGMLGIAVFIVCCRLLKCPEYFTLEASLKKKLFKKIEIDAEIIR